ncbi:MAG: lamin tail domain-containing protein [Balneolaceae bacterium]
MQILLQRNTLYKLTHIILFFVVIFSSQKITAQSVLLPGDVIIVTANQSSNSIDFIPLIDIEENTTLYFSDGIWDAEKLKLAGNEIELYFTSPVAAGTNIHVNNALDARYTIKGTLNFEGEINHVFAYQKEEGFYRFIYGAGWGKPGIWNSETSGSSDIPQSLTDADKVLFTYHQTGNIQYHLRNGASGTREMLLKFVSNPANWRSQYSNVFPPFGTSFNLLNPPVVLFDNSISTVNEGDDESILNIAIYEHDGSRLTVDVVYDSLRSITNAEDIGGFSSTKLNFTGLIGDGVYEVSIPIQNDEEYEGTETGIFTLKNLSNGNYGDFLTHSLIINDDEQPDVEIVNVVNSSGGRSFVEVVNKEQGVVSLSGWSIINKKNNYRFAENDVLLPGEMVRIYDNAVRESLNFEGKTLFTDLNKKLLDEKGGELVLADFIGAKIKKAKYQKRKATKNEAVKEEPIASSRTESQVVVNTVTTGVTSQKLVAKAVNPGWKILANQPEMDLQFPEIDFLIWDGSAQKFINAKEQSELQEEMLFGYFDAENIQVLSDWQQEVRGKQNPAQTLEFELSATDIDENERIDKIEGLNLVYNSLGKEISVHQLLSELEKNSQDEELNASVYGIAQNDAGEVFYQPMAGNAKIAANSPFWLMIDRPLEKASFSFDEAVFTNDEISEETAGIVSNIAFTLSSGDLSETIELVFNEGEEFKNVKNLNSYKELFLPKQDFISFSIQEGEEFYSKMEQPFELASAISFPVTFSTSESGTFTFKVSDWQEVPKEWMIILEDVETGKKYDLRKDFTFNFTYNTKLVEKENESDFRQVNRYESQDRFILNVYPPQESGFIDEDSDLPKELELFQNFPNPFNPLTTISFFMPEPSEVTLSVFNIVGQPVSVIMKGSLSAGQHHFDWDATDHPSGMYIYQLETGRKVMTRKMTLVK